MRDLEVHNIPLENVTLQRLNPFNKEHKKAISKLRDKDAKKMMYDVKQAFIDIKKNRDLGNSFLLKDKEEYIGYIYISNRHNKTERTISYMIEKTVRNKGYGKIVLNSISEYIFEECLADTLVLYIKDKNKPSISVAESCDFKYDSKLGSTNTSIYKRTK